MKIYQKPTWKLVFKILTIVIVLIVVDSISGIVLKKLLYIQKDGRYFKILYSLEKTAEDILIVGSSRAETNFVPEVFEEYSGLSCFNTGRGGQGLPFFRCIQEAVLNRYSPKVVILNFDDEILLRKKIKYDYASILLPFYKHHPEIQPILNKKKKYEKYFALSNLYAYNSSPLYFFRPFFLKNVDGKTEDKGWKPMNGKMKMVDGEKTSLSNELEGNPINLEALNELEILIGKFVEAKSKLCITISPKFNRTLSENISTKKIKELCGKYNAELFDYSFDKNFVGNKNFFYDKSHLNKEGAMFFSKELAGDIFSEEKGLYVSTLQ